MAVVERDSRNFEFAAFAQNHPCQLIRIRTLDQVRLFIPQDFPNTFEVDNGAVITATVHHWRMDSMHDRPASMHTVVPVARNDKHLLVPSCGIHVVLALFDVPPDAATVRRIELCDVADLQIVIRA